MYWFATWVEATPEFVGARLFRGETEQGKALLSLFRLLTTNGSPPPCKNRCYGWTRKRSKAAESGAMGLTGASFMSRSNESVVSPSGGETTSE
jgi:hypothetical protein